MMMMATRRAAACGRRTTWHTCFFRALMSSSSETTRAATERAFLSKRSHHPFGGAEEREEEEEETKRILYQEMRTLERAGLFDDAEALFHDAIRRHDVCGVYSNAYCTVDLHQCDRRSAECVLRYTLRRIAGGFGGVSSVSEKLGGVAVVRNDLRVITGLGRHSPDGQSVLRPHVTRFLAVAPSPPLSCTRSFDGGSIIVDKHALQDWVFAGAKIRLPEAPH